MKKWIEIAAALFALAAAVFWFASAYGTLPVMKQYWGFVPSNDPFYRALKLSAAMNTVASVFSALSAVCVFLRQFIR